MQQPSDKRVIWIILDHPWQLFLALAIVKSAPVHLQFRLVASKHKYWPRINLNQYLNKFEKVFFFDEPRRARSPLDAFRFLRQSRLLKIALKALPIGPNDILLTLCYYTYLENLLTAVFPRNRRVFVMRDDAYQIYDLFSANLKNGIYREAKSSLLHRLLLEPLLSLKKKTRFVWIKTPENFHDLAFEKRPEIYYDKVFRLRSQTAPDLSPAEIYYPYPLLSPASKNPAKLHRVVFFLSDYIKNPDYYQKISQILEFLAAHFGKEYLLELRAHPNRLE